MKIIYLLIFTTSFCTIAQSDVELEFSSNILEENRSMNIHIPASYESSDKSYPVIYSLDGEYSKFVVNGTMDYYSFWDKIPECIVVSINQNYLDTVNKKYKRWIDCTYSWDTGLPKDESSKFIGFISNELIPFIDSSYRTTNFRAIIGHSFTANFVNYFLLDDQPLFTGYIAISPYYAKNGLDSIKAVIENIDDPVFYYVASGENDLTGHIKSVNEFDQQFSRITNSNFNYTLFDMKNNQATHYTILSIALPDAIEHIFSKYTPIGETEFKKILKTDDKVGYLKNRYSVMNQIYGVKISIRETDINTISYAISKKKQWEQLRQIADLALELYPESYLGFWTMGEYFENTGDYKSALEQYEIGFNHLGDDILNKADFKEDIDRVKKKI